MRPMRNSPASIVPTLIAAGRSSAWSERRLWEAEAVGSNPTVPIRALLEEPVAVPHDRNGRAGCVHAVDLQLVRPDHEVGVDRGVVDASLDALLGRQLPRPRQR